MQWQDYGSLMSWSWSWYFKEEGGGFDEEVRSGTLKVEYCNVWDFQKWFSLADIHSKQWSTYMSSYHYCPEWVIRYKSWRINYILSFIGTVPSNQPLSLRLVSILSTCNEVIANMHKLFFYPPSKQIQQSIESTFHKPIFKNQVLPSHSLCTKGSQG